MKKNKIKTTLNKSIVEDRENNGICSAPLFLKITKSSTGFTILEILVSMTLFIFVILLSNSFFSFSQKAYNKGSERSELIQNVRVSLDRVTRELRQAGNIITDLPATEDNPLDPPTEEIFFQDGHDISQITYLRYYLDNSDLKRDWLAYYFSEDPSIYVIHDSVDQLGNPPDELVLSNRIVGEYFSKLNFWGTSNLINIYAELSKKSSQVSVRSSIFSRN